MKTFWKSSLVRLVAVGAMVALLFTSVSPINVSLNNPLTRNQFNLEFGYVRVVSASGTFDYPLTQTGIQNALNALPAVGGKINLMNTNNATITFTGTVARAIPNVIWQGSGTAAVFTNNGVTALFSAGGQTGWVFRDIATDAGGITQSADTVLENVRIGTTLYALKTTGNYPTGRGNALVVAASDASALEKAQADYIVDSAANETGHYQHDDYWINLAINSLGVDGGRVQLTSGNYTTSAPIVLWDNTSKAYSVILAGQGKYVTTIKPISGSTFNAIENLQTDIPAGTGQYREIDDLGINFTSPTAGSGIYASNNSTTQSLFDFAVYRVSVSGAFGYGIYAGGTLVQTWGTRIEDCWVEFSHGVGVHAFSNQAYIAKNFIAYGDNIGLEVTGAHDVVVIGNNVRSNKIHGIYASANTSIIEGNVVYLWGTNGSNYYGIFVSGTNNLVIGNTVTGDFSAATYYGIGLNDNSSGTIISGNTVNRASNSEIILLSGSATTGAVISNNALGNGGSFRIRNLATGSMIIRGNANYVSENSGTANITTGTTAIDVTHGLAAAPIRVFLTPKNNPTNPITYWYAGNFSSTKFTIWSNADPGASGLQFDWRAVIGEGN